MTTGVFSWSQTAASNATADSTVNWAEGMAPASINDSARAMMASMAKYRDDLNGSITTSGTSTAYTVASNQGLALTAGYAVAFIAHVTSGGTTTLSVDSLGAKPLRPAPGVELAAGAIVLGIPYVATYYASNSGEWIVHGLSAAAWATGFASTETTYVSAITLSTGAAANLGSLPLPAGDWDVYGNVGTKSLSGSPVITYQTGWINSTSASEPVDPNEGAKAYIYQPSGGSASAVYQFAGIRKRVLITNTTTYYLGISATFTGGGIGAFGHFAARRVL